MRKVLIYNSLQPAGRNPLLRKSSSRLQERIRNGGEFPAACKKESAVPNNALQVAGRYPQRRKCPCKLQEGFQAYGKFPASCRE